MDLELTPADSYTPVTIQFGFRFPHEQTDLAEGTENACKLFGPETINCGKTEDGKLVEVQIVGALLGETHREIVPHTYSHMGLWLSKDYIRIERNNEILEDVFSGQYYYRSLLMFANCQQFDLTANRNNIRNDQEEYDLAINGIKNFCEQAQDDDFLKDYFKSKGRKKTKRKKKKMTKKEKKEQNLR